MFDRATRALLLVVALAPACAVGPDYKRPAFDPGSRMPEVAAIATTTAGRIAITDAPTATDRYWEVFHDPLIDELVKEALTHNQDLRAALARVLAARSVVHEEFAPLIPYAKVLGAYSYVKLPGLLATGGATPPGASPLAGQPFQSQSGVLYTNYEVDLWGRLRRGLEAASSEEIASDEDRKGVEITVVGDVIQTYFDVCEAGADLTIAREAVSVSASSLEIVRERFAKGFATELDLRRAESLLASLRAQVPDAERRRATAEHKLAILLGHLPDRHFAARPPAEFDLPPSIPAGVPAALLDRRPDVRAAEARLSATNARIGATIAEYFPSVSIFGAFGQASLDITKISHEASNLFVAGPVLRFPIFQAGLTYARVEEARARNEENEAKYVETILLAFGEIADAVVGIDAHERQRDELDAQVKALTRAVDLSSVQYKTGFVTFLDVLDAQRALLEARQSLVHAQRQVLGDIVTLQKALGGGWHEIEADGFEETLVEPVLPPK
jgi:NodT family efflux transporter outer membrane factor (OMF) lipoprotein